LRITWIPVNVDGNVISWLIIKLNNDIIKNFIAKGTYLSWVSSNVYDKDKLPIGCDYKNGNILY